MSKKGFEEYVCKKCFRRVDDCICPTPPMYLVQIDSGIQEPIRILNEKGWTTTYCCEGHFDPEQIIEDIYVAFKAPWETSVEISEGWKVFDRKKGKSIRRAIKYPKKMPMEDREAYFNAEKERGMAELIRWAEALPVNENRSEDGKVRKEDGIEIWERHLTERDYVCIYCAFPVAQCTCGANSPWNLLYVPYEIQEPFRELSFKEWRVQLADIEEYSEERTKARIRIVFAEAIDAPQHFPDGWVVNDNRIFHPIDNGRWISYAGKPQKVSIVGEIEYGGDGEDRRRQYDRNLAKKLGELLDWAKALPDGYD